jgi:hypothetical protein
VVDVSADRRCSRATCGPECLWRTIRTDGDKYIVVVDQEGPVIVVDPRDLPTNRPPWVVAQLASRNRKDRAVAQHVVHVLLAGAYRTCSVMGTDLRSPRHDRFTKMVDDELALALSVHSDDERRLLESLWVDGELTYPDAVATAQRLLA